MKKVSVIIALCLIGFASCNKNLDEVSNNHTYTFTLSTETDSKAILGENGTDYLWQESDSIIVVQCGPDLPTSGGVKNLPYAKFLLTSGAGTKIGTFKYTGPVEFDETTVKCFMYSGFPVLTISGKKGARSRYDPSSKYWNNFFNIPQEQEYHENNIMPGAAPMYRYSKTFGNLKFYHAGAVIRIPLCADNTTTSVSEITLSEATPKEQDCFVGPFFLAYNSPNNYTDPAASVVYGSTSYNLTYDMTSAGMISNNSETPTYAHIAVFASSNMTSSYISRAASNKHKFTDLVITVNYNTGSGSKTITKHIKNKYIYPGDVVTTPVFNLPDD